MTTHSNEVKALKETIKYLEKQNEILWNLLRQSQQKPFKPKAESVDQLSLFGEETIEEATIIEISPSKTQSATKASKPKKTKGHKQAILDNFPAEDLHHELSGEACLCPSCQGEMKDIGSRKVREDLVFIPASYKVVRHIEHAYKCDHCQTDNGSDLIIKAKVPVGPLNASMGSASLITETIHQKFILKVPNHRQEQVLEMNGLDISRQTISNWHLRISERYLEPLVDLMHKELLCQAAIHCDETPYRVLRNDKTNSYYWIFTSGKHEAFPVALYHFSPSRSGEVPKKVLQGFTGTIHADMYQGYNQVGALIAGCWAHLRRKFFDAAHVKKGRPKKGKAAQALNAIQKIYALEREWQPLSIAERFDARQNHLRPQVEAFFNWVRELPCLPTSLLGKAVEYALKYEAAFRVFLSDGRLEIDNNRAERCVKSIVMGRKNWLFSNTEEGAKSNGIIMSVIETAKANGINPTRYIGYLLEKLPNLNIGESLEAYLPWHPDIQAAFSI